MGLRGAGRDPKLGTYVQGLSETTLEDSAGLTEVIESGNRRRAVAKTNMNAESSRSHAILTLSLRRTPGKFVHEGEGIERAAAMLSRAAGAKGSVREAQQG